MPQSISDEVEVAGDALKAVSFLMIDSREITQGMLSEIHDSGQRFLSSQERPFIQNRSRRNSVCRAAGFTEDFFR
jgi:hypothetical protein